MTGVERGEGPPSVLAFPLAEAREALGRAGWACAAVAVTAAPAAADGREGPLEEMRVVRQRQAGVRAVALTVARHPGPPEGA